MRTRLAYLIIGALTACERQEPARPVATVAAAAPAPKLAAAGPLRAATTTFDLAVYHLSKPRHGPAESARKLLAGAGFAVVAKLPESPTVASAVVRPLAVADMPPPDLHTLSYRGRTLDDAQKQRLQHPDSITLVQLGVPGAEASRRYFSAASIVRGLAAADDGLVYDVAARRIVSPKRLGEILARWNDGIPDVWTEISIDVYRDGELMRMVSLGMQKLALPDLVVENFAPHDQDPMSLLMSLTLQTMAERGSLPRPGELDLVLGELRNTGTLRDPLFAFVHRKNAEGRALVHLGEARRDDGDADNRLLAVVFPGPPGTLQVRQGELLARLFGKDDEEVIDNDHDDPALMRARANALAALKKLKPRFTDKWRDENRLTVKAPFATPSGKTEWMWVDVTRWQGKRLQGILENEPVEAVDVKIGQRVDVDEASLFDYFVVHRDGSTEGNETSKLLRMHPRQN